MQRPVLRSGIMYMEIGGVLARVSRRVQSSKGGSMIGKITSI